MLDQNTDRMWYVIGAIVIGAAIIAMGLNIFDSSFESVDSLMVQQIDIAQIYGEKISDDFIPDTPSEWFDYTVVDNEYVVINGFIEDEMSLNGGVYPEVLKVPKYFEDLPVRIIGSRAFEKPINQPRDQRISKLVLPNTVVEVRNHAFRNNKITDLNLPNSIETFGGGSFQHNRIGDLVIPNSVKIIGSSVFNGAGVRSVQLGNSVEYIGPYAFQSNYAFTVRIPKSVKRLNDITFDDRATLIFE